MIFLVFSFERGCLFHHPQAQHDAGWLRQAVFEKLIVSARAHLAMSIEDRGTLLIPIVLRNMPSDRASLQELVVAWYDCAPFKTALCTARSLVCMQCQRYVALGPKNKCAVIWPRTQVLLPIFTTPTAMKIV